MVAGRWKETKFLAMVCFTEKRDIIQLEEGNEVPDWIL